jgi:peroxiredoxin
VEIHLALSNFNENELNMQIVMFEDAYGPYYEKHVNDLNTRTVSGNLESDIANIEKPFQSIPDAFFRAFRQYRYGMLKLFANQQKVQSLSDEYFNNQPVLYNNPAYADLFNLVFDKYFIFYSRTEPGKQIYSDINRSGSYKALYNTLSASTNFSNDTLKELIILKQIHDEYYGDQFSRSGLLNILDSMLTLTTIDIHRKFGEEVRKKITRLQTGYAPPPFSLYNTDSLIVNLSDLTGKYIYLNFCTCQSYACLNEFNALSLLHQRQKDRLLIITIATDPLEEVLRQFLARNKYDWMFLLYDRQPDVLKDYDIRAYPTYFLIGPDGKLILSPAPSPSEDFENRLFEIMKSRGDL